jgi:NAD(P)-dependent dehydrogenase (short-subunit alcohol dehydrogenase family)
MDMADFASVSAFANAFTDKYERLDILVCNAGIAVSTFELSKHGFESTSVAASAPPTKRALMCSAAACK